MMRDIDFRREQLPGAWRPNRPVVTVAALRRRLRHLPSGLIASGVLAVVAVLVGWPLRGAAGAAGGVAGVALVALSYTISSVVIAWADAIQPKLVLPVGLATYVIKIALIGLLMAAVDASGWSGLEPMGVGVIGTVLAWIIAQSWWTWHAKIPYVELDSKR